MNRSLDPVVLQDELLQLLKASPETASLVSLRAKEILTEVFAQPIIVRLNGQIKQLQGQLDQEQRLNEMVLSSSKKEAKYYNKHLAMKQDKIKSSVDQIGNKDLQNAELKQTVEFLSQKIDEMENELNQAEATLAVKQSEIEMLQTRNDTNEASFNQITNTNRLEIEALAFKLSKRESSLAEAELNISDLQKEFFQLQKSKMEELAVIADSHREEIQKIIVRNRQELAKKQKTISDFQESQLILKDNRAKLQRQLRESKEQLQSNLHKSNELQQSLARMGEQFGLKKQQAQKEKSVFLQERKVLNQKLVLLNQKYLIHKKILASCRHNMRNLAELKQVYSKAVQSTRKQISSMREIFQTCLNSLLQKIGGKMSEQLQQLGNQIALIRQESTSKDQIIIKLERIIQNSNAGSQELKKQLKNQKRSENKLRRELLKTCEDKEVQLLMMEQKYQNILLHESSQMYR